MINNSTIKINEIKYDDLKKIEDIGKKCLPIYYKLYDLLELSEYSNYIMLKALINNKIAGFIIAEKISKLMDSDYIHIMSIGVLSEFRKQSVGTNLIKYIKEKYTYNKITLYVQKSNNIAINFYEKNLFSKTKILKNYYENLDCKDAFLYTYIK